MNDQNTIISHQVRLPWRRVVQLALKSIKKRFIRSLLTMVSVILAIAFLMSIWTNEAIVNGLKSLRNPAVNAELMKNGVNLALTGMDPKQIWLVVLSLLVCSVGILNAMLMSVTERFKEIGTMKCLGAVDSYIIRLFMVEAGIQGFMGTMLGIIFGILIGLLGGLLSYGAKAIIHIQVASLISSLFITLVIGISLCVLFAIYPAFVAASMQPVDAMRVEE